MRSTNANYFPALTGVRAIAAYMVFIHHYRPFPGYMVGKPLFNFLNEFHTGVTFFFVLSGFLITYRYYNTGALHFKKYIVNRVARIYPMYFILTTASFIFTIIAGNAIANGMGLTYLLNITFLRGYFDAYKFSSIGPGWSLTVEESFYLLAPVIFILINRHKISMLILPIGLILTGFGLVQLCSAAHAPGGLMASNEFMFNYTFFGRCCEFFIGISLALFYKARPAQRNSKYITYAGAAIILLCIFSISMFKGVNDFGIRSYPGKLINNIIMPLFGIAVFYYGLLIEKTLVSKFLGSKLFDLLGKSSYVFYLVHVGFIASLLNGVVTNKLILFSVLNVISIALYKFAEEPLNNFIRRKFNRKPVLAPTFAKIQ